MYMYPHGATPTINAHENFSQRGCCCILMISAFENSWCVCIIAENLCHSLHYSFTVTHQLKCVCTDLITFQDLLPYSSWKNNQHMH